MLGLLNTPTASLERGKTPTNECPNYDTRQSDGEVLALDLGNMEYPFIAFAPRPTLARNGNT